jgi:O-antigen ligase
MFLAAVILNLILILLRFIHVLPDSLFPSFFENEVFKDRIFTSLFFSVASYIMCIYIINNKIFDLKNFILSTLLTTMLYYLFAISCGRSGQLILLCLIVLLFFQNFRFKYIIYSILWLSTIIIFVVTIVPCSFSSRIDLAIKEVILFIYFPDIPTSNGFRLWMLKNSILLYLQKPWFGWGIGSIINAFSTLDNQMYGSVENPHNQFLVYMLQFGMLGVFAIGNLLWRIYKTSLTINVFYKNILQGLLLALIVGCMGNSWLNDFTSAHFFIFLLAILISSPGREMLKK